MADAPTCDPSVVTEARSPVETTGDAAWVRYRRADGRRWEVWGTCNQCGACWEGAVGQKPELDCPVTPEFWPTDPRCSLTHAVELEPFDSAHGAPLSGD